MGEIVAQSTEAKTEETPFFAYVGEHDFKLDDRNRVAVPKSWRVPGDTDSFYFAWPYPDGYLQVLPRPRYLDLLAAKKRTRLSSPAKQRAFNQIFRDGEMLSCDGQGRVLLSKKLCAKVGIGPRAAVKLVGGGDLFEIHDNPQPDAESADEASPDDILAALAEAGI